MAHYLAVYASLSSVARREARLATDLSATTLVGLDFHQLDSMERFHLLISIPPSPKLSLALKVFPFDTSIIPYNDPTIHLA